MKVKHTSKKYLDGGDKPKFDNIYDYLLFRQDFFGTESIYFDENELEEVQDKMATGEIVIHMNYSILFCKNKQLMKLVETFPCCTFLWSDYENK